MMLSRGMAKCLVVVGLCAAPLVPRAWASSPRPQPQLQSSDQAAEFEVLSIKPRGSGGMPVAAAYYQLQPGGRFRGVGMTARGLVAIAFQTSSAPLLSSQIAGGPGWLGTSQFDIVGTVGKDLTNEAFAEHLPMFLRAMLESRFKLAVHIEQRRIPVYVLVVARAGGRLGSQLRPSLIQDCPGREQNQERVPVPTTLPSVSTGRPTCSVRILTGNLVAGGISMRGLAGALTTAGGLDRPVLDRTDLVSRFDVDLRWSTDRARAGQQLDPLSSAPSAEGASLFTALQEQLGLKLEPRIELADVVVIDRIEQPTPN